MALDSTNPALTLREINQIPTTINAPAELLGALLETEKRLSGGAYQSAKLPVGILLQAAAQLLPGPNDRKDLRKTARCYDATTPEYFAGDATLVDLNPEFLCLGTQCLVYFSPAGYAKTYIVAYDPSGPLQVFADGRFTGPKAPARWVLQDSEEAATTGVDTFNELTDFYQRGKQVIATLQGSAYARLFELQPQDAALTQIRRIDFADNKIPAPTGQPGDAYWVERPLSMPGYVGYQVIGRGLALSLEQNSEVAPARLYRLYRYLDQEGGGDVSLVPPRAEFDILLFGLTPNSFSGESLAWQIDNFTDQAVAVGTYNLATDTFTADSTYWGALQASPNDSTTIATYVSQQLLSYVLNNDARLNDARRIITARTGSGVFYTGPDGDLPAAVGFAGEHGLITIQQVYNLLGSFVLPRGVVVVGNHRFFRLDGHRITLGPQSRLCNMKLEYIAAVGGDVYSAHGANNGETPQVDTCELRVDVNVAAGCFMRLKNCDIVGNNWNKGTGTILLENCREFGTAGSVEAGFAKVERVGLAGSTDFPNPITLTAAATLQANKSYRVTGSGYALALPDATATPGARIYLSVTAAATGLYPLTGSDYVLWSKETIELLATVDGWEKRGGNPQAMSAVLVSNLANQSALVVNAGNTPPTDIERSRQGPPQLVDTVNYRIVAQRKGKVSATGSVFLKNATAGVFYQFSLAIGAQLVSVSIPITNDGLGVNTVPLTGDVEAGTIIRMSVFPLAPANYRGQFEGSECSLSFVELP